MGDVGDRAVSHQDGPPPSLGGFPRRTLAAGTRLWRAAKRAPWWFSSSGHGRFDLASPRGTCYLGTDQLTGILETIGPELQGRPVSSTHLAARRLYALDLVDSRRLGDLVSRRAVGYGVTNELSAMVPYDTPRAWAEALRVAGYQGISYRTRFDPGARPRGVALFGAAGEASWPVGISRSIDADLRRRIEHECAIAVLDPPVLAELDVAALPPW